MPDIYHYTLLSGLIVAGAAAVYWYYAYQQKKEEYAVWHGDPVHTPKPVW